MPQQRSRRDACAPSHRARRACGRRSAFLADDGQEMSASLEIPTREFNRAAELCIQHSERTYPAFLNGQGLRLASFAVRETERAEASMIGAKLGQVSTRIANKRT